MAAGSDARSDRDTNDDGDDDEDRGVNCQAGVDVAAEEGVGVVAVEGGHGGGEGC